MGRQAGEEAAGAAEAVEVLVATLPLAALGALVTTISHDVNNLLGALRGRLEMIEGKAPEGSPTREHAGKALRAAGLLGEFSGALHALAAQLAGGGGEGDPREAVRRAGRLLQARGKGGPEIRLAEGADVPAAGMPAGLLTAAVALAAGELWETAGRSGAVEAEVAAGPLPAEMESRVRGARGPRYVSIRLSHAGARIDGDVLEGPLSAAGRDLTRHLALAGVGALLRQQGGAAEVESPRGGGARVGLYIPAAS
jgi:signal transduction histidine kinase